MAKCSECGFLAWRETKTRELHEVEHGCRETCVFTIPDLIHKFEPQPICFVHACDIRDELRKTTDARSVLARERSCDKFVKWNPGIMPKEHAEMMLRKQQLEWQSAESEKARAFEREQKERDRQEIERRHRESITSNRLAVFISTIISLTSLAASLYMNFHKK